MGNSESIIAENSDLDPDEIRRLEKRFRKLDVNNDGNLSLEELTMLPELKQNPLVKRVIDTFDKDGNGQVDFQEFIEGLSIFSAKSNFSREDRLKFVFRIYDIDKDGFLSNADIFKALKIMVGNAMKDSELQQVVDRVFQWNDLDCGVLISFEEFCTVIGNTDIHKKFFFDF